MGVIEIQSTVPAWHMRAMEGIKLQKENKERYVLLDSQFSDTKMQIKSLQDDEIKFLVVNQILGTFADSGIVAPYHYRLVIHYWRDKVQDSTPLVISHEYQAS